MIYLMLIMDLVMLTTRVMSRPEAIDPSGAPDLEISANGTTISVKQITTATDTPNETTIGDGSLNETTISKSKNETTGETLEEDVASSNATESSDRKTTDTTVKTDQRSTESTDKTTTTGWANSTATKNGTLKTTPNNNVTLTPRPKSIAPSQFCFILYIADPVKLGECLSKLVKKSTESASHEASQDRLYEVADDITRYLSPVIIIIGTVLNILSFIVLVFTKMSLKSSSVYLAALSVTDTLNLWLNLTRRWILAVWTLDFRDTHVVICKLSAFFAYYLPHVSAWLIVAVTLERVIYVCLPLRAKFICTKRNALIAILTIFGIFIIINGFLFRYQGPFKENPCYRISDPNHVLFRVKIWPHLDMVLSSLLPFSILMFGNVMIIASRIKAAKWKAKAKAQANTVPSAIDKQTISITLMLLSISFVFIILTLPITIHFYIFSDMVVENTNNYGDIKLSEAITSQVYFTNCAISFILYSISGAYFREQLRILFGKSRGARGSQGASSSQATETSRF